MPNNVPVIAETVENNAQWFIKLFLFPYFIS